MNKTKLLKHLLAADDYVSGEMLSKQYGVSRQSIWKHINALTNEGYLIESVRRKGYKLTPQADIGKNALARLIYLSPLFDSGDYLTAVDSTNSYAKINAVNFKTALIVTGQQTAGRGRLGRTWLAPADGSLCFSMLLRPNIAPHLAAMLTQVAALAMYRAIEQTTGLNTQIKWPNDIICGNKKVAGILTEMATELNAVEYVVIGIGVNVSTDQFDDSLTKIATSLAAQAGRAVSRLALLEAFVDHFNTLYQQFIKKADLSFIVDDLNALSYIVGHDIWLIDGEQKQAACAKYINPMGELIVEVDGQEKNLYYGEVSVRLNEQK